MVEGDDGRFEEEHALRDEGLGYPEGSSYRETLAHSSRGRVSRRYTDLGELAHLSTAERHDVMDLCSPTFAPEPRCHVSSRIDA